MALICGKNKAAKAVIFNNFLKRGMRTRLLAPLAENLIAAVAGCGSERRKD